MFITPHVEALFKKGALKLIRNDDDETIRVCEATCVIEPFTVNLARELGEEVSGHLFDDEGKIRREIDAVSLRVRVPRQRVTVTTHPEVASLATLEHVDVRNVRVTRMEDQKTGREWLACAYELVVPLDSKVARGFVLDGFGRALYWSFEASQMDFLDNESKARVLRSAARLGESGGGVTITADGMEPVHLNADTAKRHRAEAAALAR